MGLFNWKKESSKYDSKIVIDGIKLEEYIIKAKTSGTSEPVVKIWEKVLEQDGLYLLSTKTNTNPDNDFVGHFDQTNFWIYIFTEECKAQKYIDSSKTKNGFTITLKPITEIVMMLFGNSKGAVYGVYINEADREMNAHFNMPIEPLEGLIRNLRPDVFKLIDESQKVTGLKEDKLIKQEFSIDELKKIAEKSGQVDDLEKLWQAALSLEKWFFIAKHKESKNDISPFLGLIDNVGWAFVFTDLTKAEEYALHSGNTGFVDSEGNPVIIQMNVTESLNYLMPLKRQGVYGVRINDLDGWFSPLDNIPVIINSINNK
jgi:hypothetical protein